jgi:isochorismatase family protein
VLVGFETDVCVTHSAVGRAEAGYRVAVVEDDVYSPFGAHPPGVARLRDLGIELPRGKGVYYDWARTLAATRTFERDHPELASPPGFSL